MTDEAKGNLLDRADFQEFLDHFDDVIVWSGDESGFEYISSSFENIWGRPVEDVREDRSVLIEGIHPEDREKVLSAIQDENDHIAEGVSTNLEHRVVQPDGEVRWVEVRTVPLHETPTEQPQVIGVTIDITERKENELTIKRQNERLERFAQIVSHDLRNPLGTARGYLNLLKDEIDHEYIENIEQSLVRIDEIITDVLTLLKAESTVETTKLIDLEEVVQGAWMMTSTEEGTLTVDDDLGTITANEGLVRQLFENLFRNAIEHGNDGVSVRVGLLRDEDGFYVADDGSGIPEADRREVFEMGYSTSQSGGGLGLVIVKEIIDAHEWDICATDSKDGGARFEITNVDPNKAGN
jgi:PAS domain S-box-containing protein